MKWAKNEVFQILRKVDTQNFLIFLDKVIAYQLKIDLNNMEQHHKVFKIEQDVFFWEKICFEDFSPKGVQNEPKVRFFKFCEKFMHETFLIFCIKLQQHKGWKSGKTYFVKIVVVRFGRQKALQMDTKLSFLCFVENGSLCFITSRWSYISIKLLVSNYFVCIFLFFWEKILLLVFGWNHLDLSWIEIMFFICFTFIELLK